MKRYIYCILKKLPMIPHSIIHYISIVGLNHNVDNIVYNKHIND